MRLHDGRVIPTFMRQALANEPLTVYGDGSQTRSFCYVDDLVRGLVLLARSGEHLPVNIGNPQELTLLELAQTVIDVTGSKSEIVYEALPVTTRRFASPTSHAPGSCWAGSRRSRSTTDCGERSGRCGSARRCRPRKPPELGCRVARPTVARRTVLLDQRSRFASGDHGSNICGDVWAHDEHDVVGLDGDSASDCAWMLGDLL